MHNGRHCETVCELLYLVGGQYSGCAINCANESVHNLSYFHEFRIRMDIALELVLIQVFFTWSLKYIICLCFLSSWDLILHLRS